MSEPARKFIRQTQANMEYGRKGFGHFVAFKFTAITKSGRQLLESAKDEYAVVVRKGGIVIRHFQRQESHVCLLSCTCLFALVIAWEGNISIFLATQR